MHELNSPILITGCARSGTSMIAGGINLCGAFGGDLSGPNRNNKKGMFENFNIRNNIIKPYLASIGADRLGQFPLPDIDKLPIPSDLQTKVCNIMLHQGLKKGHPWFYKGAKMCLTWPIWHHAFPDAKWIIVRRKTSDIINSCIKTFFMRAFNNTINQQKVQVNNEHDGWLWWVRQHEQRFIEMMTEGLNCKVVWPHRMVKGDYRQMMETIEWLGLKWNSEVLSFIDPQLWHSRNH